MVLRQGWTDAFILHTLSVSEIMMKTKIGLAPTKCFVSLASASLITSQTLSVSATKTESRHADHDSHSLLCITEHSTVYSTVQYTPCTLVHARCSSKTQSLTDYDILIPSSQ